MRKKKMLDAMSMLDDDLVAEAAPKGRRSKKRTWITLAATAACFGIVLGSLGIYRLTSKQNEDISHYRDSEYYPLIQKLTEFEENKATDVVYTLYSNENWFDRIVRVFGATKKDAEPESAIEDGGNATGSAQDGSQSYEEATDNQVKGVIEGDLVKRSDRYIYYLNKDKAQLHVYAIAGEETQEITCVSIPLPTENVRLLSYKSFAWEMYLSADCRTLSIVAPYLIGRDDERNRYETAVISLDVSDLTAIHEKGRITVAGEYHSSRLVDGKLYLLNRFWVQNPVEWEKEETFVPQLDCGEGFESMDMSQIVIPDEVTSTGYTVICRLDEQTLTLEDSISCLSYVSDLYASQDSLYLVRGYMDNEKDGDTWTQTQKTDILRVRYADGDLTPCETATVKGSVKDQYSLDEYEGILRMVTTTNENVYREDKRGLQESVSFVKSEQSASLYAINIETMQTVSSVEGFAPIGETVQSVRFDGTRGYVCTAVVQSDPVFFFDLSDIHNITYRDTGTIPGFSTSLIQYGNGLLLGIGEENGKPKVEVYAEAENTVISLDKYLVNLDDQSSTYYNREYKSYLIDREAELFGFLAQTGSGKKIYLILSLEGGALRLIERIDMGTAPYSMPNFRGLHIDGCVYVFVDGTFAVRDITSPTKLP